jgi:hypothetical protein
MAWAQVGKRFLVLAVAFAFLLSICPRGGAQGANYVKVVTDYEMLGAQDLHGGGHLTYTVEGSAAHDLRLLVLRSYDGSVSPYVRNGMIEASELKYSEGAGYVADLERELEGVSFFAGGTVSFDPLHEGQGEPITIDAEGFVGENPASSNVAINIYLYFDAKQMAGTRPAVDTVVPLLFQALYLPFTNASTPLSQVLWGGQYIYSHTDYRVGVISFYNTRVTSGDVYVFRTPAGEITKYDVTFDGTSYPSDRTAYSSFDFLENPQVLFILMFLCAYFTSAMPNRFWANYKLSHPRRYRLKAKKISWIHILSKVLIVLLLLFYFIPNMFMIFGISFFLSGIIIWIFGIIFAVVMTVVAKKYYDKAMLRIPEEPVAPAPPPRPVQQVYASPQPHYAPAPVQVVVAPTPIATGPPCGMCKKGVEHEAEMTKCVCGKVYHKQCIAGVKACPFCSEPFPGIIRKKEVQCPTCGEINKVLEGAVLMSTKCKACGVVMVKVEPGYNYLIISHDRATVYDLMVNLLKSKKLVGLCITSTFPEKVKKEYNLQNTDVVWVSDTTGDPTILNPKRLEFETMRTIGNFLKGKKDAVLMLDGFEYLIVENGFEKVLKFIKKINDLSSVNHSTFLVPLGPDSITPEQVGTLRKEFDKVIDATLGSR